MTWYVSALTVLGGLALGSLAAYINYRLSRSRVGSENLAAVMTTNFLRFIIDAVTLTAGYFVSRLLDLPLFAALISVAAGLTVVGMLLLKKLTNEIKANDDICDKDGGE